MTADTWTWDGHNWGRLEPVTAPSPRAYGAVGWDRARGGAVLFGGRGLPCQEEEGSRDKKCTRTWTRTPARTRPHLIAGFDLRSARTLEPTAADPTSRRVLGFVVRTRAGGIGHTWEDGHGEGAPVLGYSVATSAHGTVGWVPVGTVPGAAPNAPRDRTWELGHDWSCGEGWCRLATVDRWLGADGHVHVDVAPLAPQGDSPEPGRIALDYVELRVRYWRTGCEPPNELLPEGTPDGTPCSDGVPGTAGERCESFECVAD